MRGGREFEELLEVMAALRRGCPWDRVQTHASLRPYLIEEAYEAVEAVDDKDMDRLREELGDVLLQIVFHAELASEEGRFDAVDVVRGITQKLRRRHPHVFGEAECDTPGEVVVNWEAQKKLEGKGRDSVLEGIPRGMPALLRAHRLQERAARAGFPWPSRKELLERLAQTLSRQAEMEDGKGEADAREWFGDLAFDLVALARHMEVNPEDALREKIKNVTARFRSLERRCRRTGESLESLSGRDLDDAGNDREKTGG
jgi:tetrapyrrole methylase family protein/MazG family protein